MQASRIVRITIMSTAVVALASLAAGQDQEPQSLRQDLDRLRTDFETTRQQYEARILALEARLAEQATAAATPAIPEPLPVPPIATTAGAASAKVFNPDTLVIGNFVGTGGENPLSNEPSLSLTCCPRLRPRSSSPVFMPISACTSSSAASSSWICRSPRSPRSARPLAFGKVSTRTGRVCTG